MPTSTASVIRRANDLCLVMMRSCSRAELEGLCLRHPNNFAGKGWSITAKEFRVRAPHWIEIRCNACCESYPHPRREERRWVNTARDGRKHESNGEQGTSHMSTTNTRAIELVVRSEIKSMANNACRTCTSSWAMTRSSIPTGSLSRQPRSWTSPSSVPASAMLALRVQEPMCQGQQEVDAVAEIRCLTGPTCLARRTTVPSAATMA